MCSNRTFTDHLRTHSIWHPQSINQRIKTLGASPLTAALLMLFIKPLTLMIFRQPGDNGVGFFVVGVFLYAFTGASWLGLGAFEAGRLLGKHHGKPTDNR
jgi:hypothetical protein